MEYNNWRDNDVEYLLNKDNSTKKLSGRCASARANRVKVKGSVKLPSDNLKKSEINKMNGEINMKFIFKGNEYDTRFLKGKSKEELLIFFGGVINFIDVVDYLKTHGYNSDAYIDKYIGFNKGTLGNLRRSYKSKLYLYENYFKGTSISVFRYLSLDDLYDLYSKKYDMTSEKIKGIKKSKVELLKDLLLRLPDVLKVSNIKEIANYTKISKNEIIAILDALSYKRVDNIIDENNKLNNDTIIEEKETPIMEIKEIYPTKSENKVNIKEISTNNNSIIDIDANINMNIVSDINGINDKLRKILAIFESDDTLNVNISITKVNKND